MAHNTSWDGEITKRLRKRGLKGSYTRYEDRRTKKGLEIVTPTKHGLIVRNKNGSIKKFEPKYHNYSGNEATAKRRYKKEIMKQIPSRLRKFIK